jgi:Druantia protein DruA
MKRKKKKTVRISARQANLKRRLRRHLSSVGFKKGPDGGLEISGTGKDMIRSLHHAQRNAHLRENQKFVSEHLSTLIKHFASGNDIDPAGVTPVLERIKSHTWQSDLFRLASLTWAVPVSHGFGRRLRYLVWDGHNQKLIGLIAIGDPVFNLAVRDTLIGWNVHDRSERLVNMMDAYVLGAVPPYNMLLGGKLVASLIRSRDLYDDFTEIYGDTAGIISGKEKKARLLAVTTSSSLGRSSVYNRLKLGGIEYLKPIGYTGGWGHFHIPDDLFYDLRAYLREIGHSYADLHRFGQGPNWRLRATRAALSALGFRAEMLRHGVQREVFICELANNALSILAKGKGRPKLTSLLSAGEVAALAVQRWIVPRSERRPEYRSWKASDVKTLLGEQRMPLRLASSR